MPDTIRRVRDAFRQVELQLAGGPALEHVQQIPDGLWQALLTFQEELAAIERDVAIPHVHTRACYDDPGPAHGSPFLVCDYATTPPAAAVDPHAPDPGTPPTRDGSSS